MKIDIIDNKIILYLKNCLIKDIDFNNIDELEEYLKTLIIKLNNIYNINVNGFYNINVYIDKIYGAILEIEQEEIDCYMGNQIEMHIISHDTIFLYEINDLIKIKNTKLIKKGFKYYLSVNNNIEYKNYIKILENSQIIYKNTDYILTCGSVVNFVKNML